MDISPSLIKLSVGPLIFNLMFISPTRESVSVKKVDKNTADLKDPSVFTNSSPSECQVFSATARSYMIGKIAEPEIWLSLQSEVNSLNVNVLSV